MGGLEVEGAGEHVAGFGEEPDASLSDLRARAGVLLGGQQPDALRLGATLIGHVPGDSDDPHDSAIAIKAGHSLERKCASSGNTPSTSLSMLAAMAAIINSCLPRFRRNAWLSACRGDPRAHL